jgi:hypothetical protein
MKTITLFLSIFILAFLSHSVAQDSTKISPKEYSNKLDSLQNLKENLLSKKNDLKSSINNLEEIKDSLSNTLKQEELELYQLKYGNELGKRVYNKQVWKGMSRQMLRDSWGKPDSLNESHKDWGTFSQWYYGDVTFFFRDGKLFEWEGEGEAIRKD